MKRSRSMMSKGSAEHLPLSVVGTADVAMSRGVAVPTAAVGVAAGSVHVALVPKLQSRVMLRSAATYSVINSVGDWLLDGNGSDSAARWA